MCTDACETPTQEPTSLSRLAVFEWQVVTVALFHSSRSCIGAPTILLRPTTTACLPAICTPERESQQVPEVGERCCPPIGKTPKSSAQEQVLSENTPFLAIIFSTLEFQL